MKFHRLREVRSVVNLRSMNIADDKMQSIELCRNKNAGKKKSKAYTCK